MKLGSATHTFLRSSTMAVLLTGSLAFSLAPPAKADWYASEDQVFVPDPSNIPPTGNGSDPWCSWTSSVNSSLGGVTADASCSIALNRGNGDTKIASASIKGITRRIYRFLGPSPYRTSFQVNFTANLQAQTQVGGARGNPWGSGAASVFVDAANQFAITSGAIQPAIAPTLSVTSGGTKIAESNVSGSAGVGGLKPGGASAKGWAFGAWGDVIPAN